MPDGRLATLGDRQVLVSADGGESWRPVGPAYPFPFVPTGLLFAPARNAFYIWRNDCDRFSDNAVGLDAIQMFSFVPAADSGPTTTVPSSVAASTATTSSTTAST